MFAVLSAVVKIAKLDRICGVRMFCGIFCTFLFKLFEAVPDILFGLMIDTVIHKKTSFLARQNFGSDLKMVYFLGGMILLAWVSGSLFQFLGALGWKQAASAIQLRLRMHLCSYVLNQHEITSGGETRDSLRSDHRMTNQEIDDVEFFVHKTLEDFFRLAFSTIVVGPLLFAIAPPFLLYAILPILPTFFVARFIQKRIRPGYNAVKMSIKRMYQEIDELLSGFGVIKDFGIEDRFYNKVKRTAQDLDAESRRTSYLTSAMSPLTRILVQFGVLAILIHAVLLVFHNEISFGEFAASSFLSRKFLLPFTFLGSLVDLCAKGTNALNNILKFTDSAQTTETRSEAALPTNIESVRMDSVKYSYGSRRIFENLTAEFCQGTLNIVKGPTGVGKSTLLRLIMGDLQPESGQIWYGSLNVHAHSESLRKNISLVTQFPKLFTASLRDNITLFDPHFDNSLFAEALDISLTTYFADELPQGIDSVVGPNGIRLSGGQMQSIAIARAFYSKARILLLDEPTSSFDLHREKEFLERLRSNLRGRIVIITSHRSQPIDAAEYLVDLGKLTQPLT
ncbi:MAG: ABC transporter ATP-binding protein [Proteobacteria bacterium]|nr:ABC transporter ATP-binding protein [Pseudomonadota bacterium]